MDFKSLLNKFSSSDQNVLLQFLNIPNGDSNAVFKMFEKLGGRSSGSGLSRYLYISGSRNDKVLLVAHADTASDDMNPKQLMVEGNKITNKNGLLGADDRAGCAIVYLLAKSGHSILIVDGEESGCVGSIAVAKNSTMSKIVNNHQFVVEFDRLGSTDFKCYSVGTDEFREYVSEVTGYSEPNRESYTDIVVLCQDICGVNLSVGYYDEHSNEEYLIISEWSNTLNVARKWLSMSNIPKFSLNDNEEEREDYKKDMELT
jgi:hypothetical protein